MASKRSPRLDREVKGKGHYGVAHGGLAGDGDITLCASRDAAVKKAIADAGCLAPHGLFVRAGWLTVDQATVMFADAVNVLEAWEGKRDGSVEEVSHKVYCNGGMIPFRVAVFKCELIGDEWHIPPLVRMPFNMTRVAPATKPPAVAKRRR